MDINQIKERLSEHPHITHVWVTDEGYFTAEVPNSTLVDLSDVALSDNDEDNLSETPSKKRKKNNHGS